jgi:hypothetical protein
MTHLRKMMLEAVLSSSSTCPVSAKRLSAGALLEAFSMRRLPDRASPLPPARADMFVALMYELLCRSSGSVEA